VNLDCITDFDTELSAELGRERDRMAASHFGAVDLSFGRFLSFGLGSSHGHPPDSGHRPMIRREPSDFNECFIEDGAC
jgi:hypothetical protein